MAHQTLEFARRFMGKPFNKCNFRRDGHKLRRMASSNVLPGAHFPFWLSDDESYSRTELRRLKLPLENNRVRQFQRPREVLDGISSVVEKMHLVIITDKRRKWREGVSLRPASFTSMLFAFSVSTPVLPPIRARGLEDRNRSVPPRVKMVAGAIANERARAI